MADLSALTEAQLSTLREMKMYSPGPYWFRQATCRSLVALGYAEVLGQHLKRPAHRITPAGRRALQAKGGA